MSKIFLYPKVDKVIGSPNPYVNNFIHALSKTHTVVNEHAKNKGVLNIFKYLFNTDIYIFNWIENLPEKKIGKVQVVLFILFIFMAKALRKKIVWILHNKYSHHKKKDKWINFMYRFMMNHAGVIITHANSGMEFVKENYPQSFSKVKLLIHPVQDNLLLENQKLEKKYDVLIWGSIYPYKGILQFLKYIKTNPELNSLKVLLVGHCSNKEYKSQLIAAMGSNFTFYDKVFEMDDISKFASLSRYILFTYKSNTVISSGSLMDSIRMGAKIIGPNHGAFKDLRHYGFLEVYDNFDDLYEILNSTDLNSPHDLNEQIAFCEVNSWDAFVENLDKILFVEKY